MEAPKTHSLRPARSPNSAQRFLVIFLCGVAVYYLVTLIPWVDRNILFPVLQLTAQACSFLIGLSGDHTTVSGIVIQGPTFSVAVRRGCDPFDPIALFSVAVIAFPAPRKWKVLALALGGFLLFTLNVVRVFSLYWLGRSKSAFFQTIHLELWPAFFIMVCLSLWVLWLIWLRRGIRPQYA
jgi:exosortase H (IPTLxxWG-CTERM-specific)